MTINIKIITESWKRGEAPDVDNHSACLILHSKIPGVSVALCQKQTKGAME